MAKRNRHDLGHVKGSPIPYVNGHNARGQRRLVDRWVEEDRSYETPCWIWQGYVGENGYGKATSETGMRGAHRVIYEESLGPIPPGMDLDHLCRVRSCVNPEHLEPVTRSINLLRGHQARKEQTVGS